MASISSRSATHRSRCKPFCEEHLVWNESLRGTMADRRTFNVVVLGLGFLFIFTAFTTCGNIEVSLFPPRILSLYLTFTRLCTYVVPSRSFGSKRDFPGCRSHFGVLLLQWKKTSGPGVALRWSHRSSSRSADHVYADEYWTHTLLLYFETSNKQKTKINGIHGK